MKYWFSCSKFSVKTVLNSFSHTESWVSKVIKFSITLWISYHMYSDQTHVQGYSCTYIIKLEFSVKFWLPNQASSQQANTGNCIKIFFQLFRTVSTVVQFSFVKHSLFTLDLKTLYFFWQLLPNCLYYLSEPAHWLSSYPAKIRFQKFWFKH